MQRPWGSSPPGSWRGGATWLKQKELRERQGHGPGWGAGRVSRAGVWGQGGGALAVSPSRGLGPGGSERSPSRAQSYLAFSLCFLKKS